VEDAGQAFHILPDGIDLGLGRYAWSGNFQGGRCTVRNPEGEYFHLDLAERPAYPERFAYAGDFREGMAVVQAPGGLHFHILEDGRPLNGRRFLDLDVFHKGYARARDEGGWHHVDLDGMPLYSCRFAAVEPIYNGQARVETLDGALKVIDEDGVTVRQLRWATRPWAAGFVDR
jgi:hypothetical protein